MLGVFFVFFFCSVFFTFVECFKKSCLSAFDLKKRNTLALVVIPAPWTGYMHLTQIILGKLPESVVFNHNSRSCSEILDTGDFFHTVCK